MTTNMINPNMIRLEMNGGKFMPPPCEQHRSYLAQEVPSEPGYGGFLLSNDAPDLSNPGYSFDTRVSSVEEVPEPTKNSSFSYK